MTLVVVGSSALTIAATAGARAAAIRAVIRAWSSKSRSRTDGDQGDHYQNGFCHVAIPLLFPDIPGRSCNVLFKAIQWRFAACSSNKFAALPNKTQKV